MKKRIFVVGLAGMLALFGILLAGCGDKETAGKSEKATSFTYWVPMDPSVATRVESYNDLAMYKQMEKDTGIHIEFIHPPLGQESEQFNLMVASRELPDMIEYGWVGYKGGAQKAIDDGVIISLNEYIDANTPNFKKKIKDKTDLAAVYDKGSKTDSGQYFAFPCFNTGNVRTFGGPIIRKDWLDDLGLSVPETIDEWTTVLRAFKKQKGATAPLTVGSNYIIGGSNAFNGAYGIGKRLYLDGKTIKFAPIEDKFKDYLATMRLWYKEGLLDKDFFTNKSNIIDSKIIKGNSGALVGYLGSAMGRYLKQMSTEDPDYNLVCAPYPVLKKGDKNNFYLSEGDVYGRYLAITTQCKDPVSAAEWADYWYSDAGYMLMNFGVEGDSYNMVDGKPVYTDKILHNPDGLSINEALCLNCRASSQAPGLKQAPEYLEQYYEFEQQVDGFKLWSENADGARSTMIPEGLSALPDESEELIALSTDLNIYVEEMCLKFVTGEEPLENFDKFVQTLKSTFKVDRYIKIEQNMYDRYMKR